MVQRLPMKTRGCHPLSVAIKMISFSLVLLISLSSKSYAMGFSDFLQAGAAFITHVAVHESGHHVVAEMVEGKDAQLAFFQKKDDNFFIGLSSVSEIKSESILPFRAAGLVASNHLYNVSLSAYRTAPSTYNKALLLFSGTDFLWYSVWSFYIQKTDDPSYDPVGLAQETGFSRDVVVGAALLQTAINFYRASSGDDTVVPYMTLDKESMGFGLRVSF